MRLGRLLPLLVIAAACSGEAPSVSWAVVDSAGITITTTAEADVPSVTPSELVLSLGTIDEGGPTEFYRVRDVEIVGTSYLAVANRGSEEVRLFRLNGAFVRSIGGEGRGPREFRGLSMIQDVGDSLFTYDSGNDRVGVRRLDGEFVRSYRLEWFRGALFPVDLTRPERTVAVTARYMTELSGTGIVVDTSLISLYDTDGRLIDSVGSLPHNARFVKQVGDFRTTVEAPYMEDGQLAGRGDGFCYVYGPDPQVECFGEDGQLREIWRVESDPRPVRPEDQDSYWHGVLADAPEAYLRAVQRVRDDVTFPEYFPAFSKLFVDDAARVWAQRYRLPDDDTETWWVFRDGRLVQRVTSPTGFEVMDVEHGWLAGVWRDEFDIEHVQVYRFETSEAG